MKKILTSTITTMLLLTNIYAETTTCDAVDTVNTSITSLTTAVEGQQVLVSKLSDDIGVMADRIGTMADKIVATETLLANTLIVLTGNADLGTSSSSTNSVVLTSPLDGSSVSKTTPPTIELSSSATTYLLYASNEPTFSDATTISLYIVSAASLSTSWNQVVNFSGTNTDVYIAVKSIDANNQISSLSNGVKLTWQ